MMPIPRQDGPCNSRQGGPKPHPCFSSRRNGRNIVRENSCTIRCKVYVLIRGHGLQVPAGIDPPWSAAEGRIDGGRVLGLPVHNRIHSVSAAIQMAQ